MGCTTLAVNLYCHIVTRAGQRNSRKIWRLIYFAGALSWSACGGPGPIDYSGPVSGWPEYGGSKEGQRYSNLTQINANNVGDLEIAWVYNTGDLSDGRGDIPSVTAFEATPILIDGWLFVPSPFNRVIALDPKPVRKFGVMILR